MNVAKSFFGRARVSGASIDQGSAFLFFWNGRGTRQRGEVQ